MFLRYSPSISFPVRPSSLPFFDFLYTLEVLYHSCQVSQFLRETPHHFKYIANIYLKYTLSNKLSIYFLKKWWFFALKKA